MRPPPCSVALAALGAAFLTACSDADVGSRAASPNVLLVTIDTLRADRVGGLGHRGGLTPALDRLAREGIVFSDAMASAPLTLPSHATILTGRDPLRHGVHDNGRVLAPSYPTISTELKKVGYRTGAFVSAVVLDARFGLARGFDVYDDRIARATRGRSTLESERACSQTVASALTWMREQSGPMFAWVHFYEPHAPWERAGAADNAPLSGYDAEVRRADACLDALITGRPASRSWVSVVASDHGEGLGDHQEQGHGLFIYQSTLRVPLVLHGIPGARGILRGDLVRTVDIAPTIATLAGVRMPEGTEGTDLLVARSGSESYAETEYPAAFGWAPLRSWRLGTVKFIDAPKPELYDLSKDPGESTNLALSRPQEVERFAGILKAARAREVARQETSSNAGVDERLRSLGYVASAAPRSLAEGGRDPKDAVPLFAAFEEALSAENRGDLVGAARGYRKLVAADRSNLVFLRALAGVESDLFDFKGAVRTLRGAVALAPRDATLATDLSKVLARVGDGREALREAHRASALEPANADVLDQLALRHAEAGDLKAALETSEQAVTLDRNSARAWTNRGNFLRAAGDRARARAAFDKALDVDARFADALNGIGVLLVEAGDFAEAHETLTRALSADPNLDDARLNLAVLEIQRGDRLRAIELAEVVAQTARDPGLRRKARRFLSDVR